MPVNADSKHRLVNLFITMEAALKQLPPYQQGRDGDPAGADWSKFARDVGPELREQISPEAVSYTHLDVYKRQFMRCGSFCVGHRGGLRNLPNSNT